MQAEQEAQFHEFVRARWSHLVRTAYLLTGDAHHAEVVYDSDSDTPYEKTLP